MYCKVLVSLAKKNYCKFSRFRSFYLKKQKKRKKKNSRPSRGVACFAGVAVRSMDEICDDFSAVLSATVLHRLGWIDEHHI
jgi:hypothetical protein